MKHLSWFGVLVLAAMLHSSPGHALGRDGHEAVCYIAYEQASQATRHKIDTLLAEDQTYSQIDDPAEAFASSCVWADKVKRKDGRSKEHYVNVPRNTKKITSLDCPEADKCLLSAIVSDAAVLSDPEASGEDKLKALKYMGHWIGDLHQPLHVSFKSDKGGNDISVGGVPGCTNMHQLWDTCLVKYFMTSHRLNTSLDLADYLMDDPNIGSLAEFRGEDTILVWANRTYKITVSHSTSYCWWKEDVCTNPVEILSEHLEKPPGVADLTLLDGALKPRSAELAELMKQGGLALVSILDKELALSDD